MDFIIRNAINFIKDHIRRSEEIKVQDKVSKIDNIQITLPIGKHRQYKSTITKVKQYGCNITRLLNTFESKPSKGFELDIWYNHLCSIGLITAECYVNDYNGIARVYGFSGKYSRKKFTIPNSMEEITCQLKSGNIVGIYTGQHFMSIYGYKSTDSDVTFTVSDPLDRDFFMDGKGLLYDADLKPTGRSIIQIDWFA